MQYSSPQHICSEPWLTSSFPASFASSHATSPPLNTRKLRHFGMCYVGPDEGDAFPSLFFPTFWVIYMQIQQSLNFLSVPFWLLQPRTCPHSAMPASPAAGGRKHQDSRVAPSQTELCPLAQQGFGFGLTYEDGVCSSKKGPHAQDTGNSTATQWELHTQNAQLVTVNPAETKTLRKCYLLQSIWHSLKIGSLMSPQALAHPAPTTAPQPPKRWGIPISADAQMPSENPVSPTHPLRSCHIGAHCSAM